VIVRKKEGDAVAEPLIPHGFLREGGEPNHLIVGKRGKGVRRRRRGENMRNIIWEAYYLNLKTVESSGAITPEKKEGAGVFPFR